MPRPSRVGSKPSISDQTPRLDGFGYSYFRIVLTTIGYHIDILITLSLVSKEEEIASDVSTKPW